MAATQSYTIYSHADADGGIAALLLAHDLRQRFGDLLSSDQSIEIVPLDYSWPSGRKWFNRVLRLPCAVLDFALHPQLLMERTFTALRSAEASVALPCYWLDHHVSGGQFPGLTPSNVGQLVPKEVIAVWDTTAISTPGLMRTHYERIGLLRESVARYETLVDYAEIVDGALYPSAAMSSDVSSPPVQLAMLFGSQHPSLHKVRFYRKLLGDLAAAPTQEPLQALRNDPLYQAVLTYEAEQMGQRRLGYARVGRQDACARVAIFDFRLAPEAWCGMARFVPYDLAPQAHWAIHVSPPDASGWCSLTCGENPWCRPPAESVVSLGELFAQHFGGGGHSFVAGGKIRSDDKRSVDDLVARLEGNARS